MSDESFPTPQPPLAAPEPERGELPGVGWGPIQVLAGLFALLVVTAVAAGVISIFDSELETDGGRLSLQAALAAALFGVAFLLPNGGRPLPGATLGLRPARIPPLRPAAAAYATYIGCAVVIAILLSPEQDDLTEQLGFGGGALTNVIVAVLVIGIAPIAEEVFFRGFMFAGLRGRFGYASAALASSGIWGLFHYTGPGTWGVVAQLAVFGIVLSWLYERTGSLRPCIAVHALNNALAFAILTS